MTSIGKSCYTDRIVIDDDIILKSLPEGKFLVSGTGGKIYYTDNTPIYSNGNQSIDGIKHLRVLFKVIFQVTHQLQISYIIN